MYIKSVKILVSSLIIFSSIVYLNINYYNKKSFSLIVLPDTQKYSENFPEIFCSQTNWIVENYKKTNIVFVSQLGDIVEHGSNKIEWQHADECMRIIDGIVPYGIIPGNHDIEKGQNKMSGFASYNTTFPVSRFENQIWYKGNYKENQNNYQIVNALKMKLLFLNLEIEPSDNVIIWANKIASENKDAYVILTTHKYLIDHGTKFDNRLSFSTDGNTGQEIWNKLIYKNCNIELVLNSHYHEDDGENRLDSLNSCNNTVHQVTQDYQARNKGGEGKLRIYTFHPDDNKINVTTYSPYTDTFETDEDSQFELTIY
jgi:hypothetical protein